MLVELGLRAKQTSEDVLTSLALAQLKAKQAKPAVVRKPDDKESKDGKESKDTKESPGSHKPMRKPVLSVIIDTVTDISTIEQLLIYARGVNNGEAITRYLGIVPVANGKADTMVKALTEFTEDISLNTHELAGFGSDGAPSMVGDKTGVATQLKSRSPYLISIHCAGHRGNLGGTQLAFNCRLIACVITLCFRS